MRRVGGHPALAEPPCPAGTSPASCLSTAPASSRRRATVRRRVGRPARLVDGRRSSRRCVSARAPAKAQRRRERAARTLHPLGDQAGAAERGGPARPLGDHRAAVPAPAVRGVHLHLAGRDVECSPASRATGPNQPTTSPSDLRQHEMRLGSGRRGGDLARPCGEPGQGVARAGPRRGPPSRASNHRRRSFSSSGPTSTKRRSATWCLLRPAAEGRDARRSPAGRCGSRAAR